MNKVYVFLVLTAILWGGNPVTVKYVVGQIHPMIAVFIRFLGISSFLVGLTLYKEGIKGIPNRKQWPDIVIMGTFGIFINNAFQFTGLQYTSVVNCSLISATTPAMTAVFTSVFMKDKLNYQQWLGVGASLLGVIIVVTKGSFESLLSLNFNYGDILIFFSQVSWAFYSIKGRTVMKTMSPIAVTGWTGLVSTILFFVFAIQYGFDGTVNLNPLGWGSMFYMIIGSGILAFCWWNQGVSVVGPNRTAIFTNLIPIAGMCLAALILQESISWQQLLGAIWIIAGVFMTTQTFHFGVGQKTKEMEVQ